MLRTIVREYGWIHRGIGLFGNFAFVVGSVLFLPEFEPWKVTGVWLFIVGAAFMFVGALGLIGIPPLLGFFAKFFVFAAAVEADLVPLEEGELGQFFVNLYATDEG